MLGNGAIFDCSAKGCVGDELKRILVGKTVSKGPKVRGSIRNSFSNYECLFVHSCFNRHHSGFQETVLKKIIPFAVERLVRFDRLFFIASGCELLEQASAGRSV